MSLHRLRLSGPGTYGSHVPAALLRDLLDALTDAVEQTIRLRVEGRSRAHGRAPAWLERAGRFDLVAIESGSTQLVFEAPSLHEAAPELFAQGSLFAPIPPEGSCLDLVAQSMNDALAERPESDLYDDGLVDTFQSFSRVFRHQVERLELLDGPALTLDASGIETFRRLQGSLPPDQRVLVEGKLDLLRHSDRFFTLLLDAGSSVRGVITSDELDSDALGRLWGRRARVEGRAKFRPSGSILRVEAERIEPASDRPSPFAELPRPLFGTLGERALSKPQGPRSGVGAILGQWPGSESEEEFQRALDELS
jgi:hypothetical protein